MVDLEGKEKGNISLPKRLQSSDIQDDDYPLNEENKVVIMNMQKAMYELKIADLEMRIKRLTDRNEYILDECKNIEFSTRLKNTETNNNIAELNREILQETQKIKTYSEKVENIEQERLENKLEHEKQVKLIQEKYDKTRLSLISQMKVLNAKINTLEDFKMSKEELVEKLKTRDDIMEHNREKLKQTLKQIDRDFKIAREKTKNDLHKRLLNLSIDFQTEITQSLSLPVRRVIRKNIAIQNELIQIDEKCSEQATNFEKKYSKEIYRDQIRDNRTETFRHIAICKIQASLISALKVTHLNMKQKLTCAELIFNNKYLCSSQEKYLKNLETKNVKLDFQRRELEVCLHQIQMRANSAINKKKQSQYTIKKLKQILYDLKFASLCGLKILGPDEELEKMTYKQLLSYLLNKIKKNKSELWIAPINSTETIFPTDIAYQVGDLGFDLNQENQEIIPGKETEPSLKSGLEFLNQTTEISFSVNLEPKNDFFIKSMEKLESSEESKISTDDDNEGIEEEKEKEEIESSENTVSDTEIETEIHDKI